MRRNLEPIEIQDPPIQELGKKSSCLKRTCFTGCGCIIIFILAALLALKLISGPRTKELNQLPADFPAGIPIYDKDSINKITYISGKQKSRGLEIAAYAPKLVLSPIILLLNKNSAETSQTAGQGRISIAKESSWKEFVKLMQEPVADHRNLLQIEWLELGAEPNFIQDYFSTELQHNDFSLGKSSQINKTRQFSFSQEEKNIEGALYIEDDSAKKGTDYVSLTVNYPLQDNNESK